MYYHMCRMRNSREIYVTWS
uniref:Uncharacterized protein n=1 Tax=Arundo donax TaxID=35708 RepID=A0A0A9FXK1_ARUDO